MKSRKGIAGAVAPLAIMFTVLLTGGYLGMNATAGHGTTVAAVSSAAITAAYHHSSYTHTSTSTPTFTSTTTTSSSTQDTTYSRTTYSSTTSTTSTTSRTTTSTTTRSTSTASTTSSTMSTTVGTSTTGLPTGIGIIVPLYMDPNSYWTQLIQAKDAYPSVPVIAIINPDNGPGRSSESNYVSYVHQFASAGIITYGYVDTMETSLSISSAESQIQQYASWYGVNGIFLDDMPDGYSSSVGSYFSTLTAYAHSLNLVTQANPGATVPTQFFSTVDSLMIYESNRLPSASSIQSAVAHGAGPSHFSMIATSVSLPSQTYINSIAPYVSSVWFTNYSPDYQELPSTSYLNGLMSELAAA